MGLHPSDYRVAVAGYAAIFGEHEARRGFDLPSRNLMTPEILGFVMAPTGHLVEISTGMSFRDDRIFGVTYQRQSGDAPDERDGCFVSLAAVHAHIYGGD